MADDEDEEKKLADEDDDSEEESGSVLKTNKNQTEPASPTKFDDNKSTFSPNKGDANSPRESSPPKLFSPEDSSR